MVHFTTQLVGLLVVAPLALAAPAAGSVQASDANLFARDAPNCFILDQDKAPRSGIQECINELDARGPGGTDLCSASNRGNVICSRPGTTIWGTTIGQTSSSSWCHHVADALRDILNTCSGDRVGGTQFAYGNGNFQVKARP